MPEASAGATESPVAGLGCCRVRRLNTPHIFCSPLEAAHGLQQMCLEGVQKCLILSLHIFSMTYWDLLMDCSAQRCQTCLASAKQAELIPVILPLCFWVSPLSLLYHLILPTLVCEREAYISIFLHYLRECYTQEWVVQEQKGTFSVSGENSLILHRIIQHSLSNRGGGLFDWEGKRWVVPAPQSASWGKH